MDLAAYISSTFSSISNEDNPVVLKQRIKSQEAEIASLRKELQEVKSRLYISELFTRHHQVLSQVGTVGAPLDTSPGCPPGILALESRSDVIRSAETGTRSNGFIQQKSATDIDSSPGRFSLSDSSPDHPHTSCAPPLLPDVKAIDNLEPKTSQEPPNKIHSLGPPSTSPSAVEHAPLEKSEALVDKSSSNGAQGKEKEPVIALTLAPPPAEDAAAAAGVKAEPQAPTSSNEDPPTNSSGDPTALTCTAEAGSLQDASALKNETAEPVEVPELSRSGSAKTEDNDPSAADEELQCSQEEDHPKEEAQESIVDEAGTAGGPVPMVGATLLGGMGRGAGLGRKPPVPGAPSNGQDRRPPIGQARSSLDLKSLLSRHTAELSRKLSAGPNSSGSGKGGAGILRATASVASSSPAQASSSAGAREEHGPLRMPKPSPPSTELTCSKLMAALDSRKATMLHAPEANALSKAEAQAVGRSALPAGLTQRLRELGKKTSTSEHHTEASKLQEGQESPEAALAGVAPATLDEGVTAPSSGEQQDESPLSLPPQLHSDPSPGSIPSSSLVGVSGEGASTGSTQLALVPAVRPEDLQLQVYEGANEAEEVKVDAQEATEEGSQETEDEASTPCSGSTGGKERVRSSGVEDRSSLQPLLSAAETASLSLAGLGKGVGVGHWRGPTRKPVIGEPAVRGGGLQERIQQLVAEKGRRLQRQESGTDRNMAAASNRLSLVEKLKGVVRKEIAGSVASNSGGGSEKLERVREKRPSSETERDGSEPKRLRINPQVVANLVRAANR